MLNISAIPKRSRFLKSFPKSLRNLSIRQTEGREITLYDLKQISATLRNNKSLHTLNLQPEDYDSSQLKIFAERLRKLHRLKTFTIYFSFISRDRGAQTLLSLPKYLQDLTYLKLSFHAEDWRSSNLNGGKKLNFGLKNLKHLTSLYLDVSDEETMNVEDMEVISYNLKTCRYLQNLTLDFDHCELMPNKAVYNLTSALQNLHSLSELNLRFKHCYVINRKAAQSLASCFSSLQNITSLTLNLGHCSKMNSTAIIILSKALREFKSLKALDFFFPFHQDAKEGIYFFFQDLVHIKTLQSLKFHISAYNETVSEDLFKSISEALKAQTQLNTLTIELKGLEIKGLWAKHLAEGLKGLQSLSDLVLNFKNNKSFDDKNAEFLGEGFRELCSLSALQINFKNHNFSQKGLRKVLEGLGALKTLRKLDLILDQEKPEGFSFTFFNKNSHTRSLASALNNLKYLQRLSLNFALLNSTGQDFSQFSFQLGTLKQLTTLSLAFGKLKSSKVIEKGLQDIFSSLRCLSDLTDLSLKAQYGSNKDLSSFFDSLKYLLKLESLELDFLELKGFSFETANQFIEAMEKLEKLSKLNLNIDFESKVEKEVSLFLTGILKLKSLSTLQYYFGRVETVLALSPFLEKWRKIKTIKSLICYDGLDEIL